MLRPDLINFEIELAKVRKECEEHFILRVEFLITPMGSCKKAFSPARVTAEKMPGVCLFLASGKQKFYVRKGTF